MLGIRVVPVKLGIDLFVRIGSMDGLTWPPVRFRIPRPRRVSDTKKWPQ